MLSVFVRKAEIEFGMKVSCGMDAHLQSPAYQVIAELQDAFFYLGGVFCVDDVLLELLVVNLFGFLFVGQHQERFVVLAENVIDIDANQYLDFADVTQFTAQLEISRGTEESYDGKKTVEGGHL